MASRIAVSVSAAEAPDDAQVWQALEVFSHVEQVCSRFRPASALSRCNARPGIWHRAPAMLRLAMEEAHRAHAETDGAFDPRVHDRLVELGYSRSFAAGPDAGPQESAAASPAGLIGSTEPWRPRQSRRLGLVHLDGRRIDLGGIGKGLALRWAAEAMKRSATDYLIDAGGDLVASGSPGDGGWRVGIESPDGDDGPVAVLEVHDVAVATSSVRIRCWTAGQRQVHHLIDPRTGQPGGEGLLSVTVVGSDPAWSEVWSKALFLAGEEGIAGLAEQRKVAALWVPTNGIPQHSRRMDPYVAWIRP